MLRDLGQRRGRKRSPGESALEHISAGEERGLHTLDGRMYVCAEANTVLDRDDHARRSLGGNTEAG